MAALLLLTLRAVVKSKHLFEAPVGTRPPPFWIRGLLVLTCTGVSFAHGSNDGQKGMGLIMLILIGTVPTAYALNHAVTARDSQDFVAVSVVASQTLNKYATPGVTIPADPHEGVTAYIRNRTIAPDTVGSIASLMGAVGQDMARYKELKAVPADQTRNFRNDMYLVGEALRIMEKSAPADHRAGRHGDHQELSQAHRQVDEVHPAVGQGRGRDRARPGHDDRLEAHRGHRR